MNISKILPWFCADAVFLRPFACFAFETARLILIKFGAQCLHHKLSAQCNISSCGG